MEPPDPSREDLRYVRALTRAIEHGAPRPRPDKYLPWYLEMDAPAHLHALLAAWASHAVSALRVGAFVMDDRAIHESFRLPVWQKDGRGPHADVERVEGRYREDVIVLGTETRSDGTRWIVGLERSGTVVRDSVLTIDGPYNARGQTLDGFLGFLHRGLAPGETSALDPWLERSGA